MRSLLSSFRGIGPEDWLGASAAAALGVAGILVLAGTLSSGVASVVSGGVLAASAVLLLFTAGWLDPLWLVALSLPLPALYASDEVRVPPVVLVSLMAVAAWILRKGLERDRLLPPVAQLRPLIFLVLVVILSAAFAQEPVAAAREVANFALLLGLFALTLDHVDRRPDRAHLLTLWIAIAAAGAGAAALPQAWGLLPARFPLSGSGFFRATGGFGWPNELGMFLAISFPFVVHEVRTARAPTARAAAVTALALAAGGLIFTFSRGSWLALLLSPLVLVVAGEGRTAVRFWAAALLGGVLFNLASGGAITDRITATFSDVLVGQRLLLTLAGLLMFRAHPFLGVGPGGFEASLNEYGLQVSGLFDFVASAQNGYVQMAAEVGIAGLVAMLVFMGATFVALLGGARRFRRRRATALRDSSLRTTLLWAFTVFCLVSLFEWPFAHGIGELAVVVAAAGVALARSDAQGAGR